MKIELLPSTFESGGVASLRQHYASFVVNDRVAIDAGSLAQAASIEQRANIRDVIITHPHLDHIAGLPLFVDDLFSELTAPVCVHATRSTIDALETHIFNWTIYPRFSELKNDFGTVLEYSQFEADKKFKIGDLEFAALAVNHQIPTVGLIVSDGASVVAFTSDTAETDDFWNAVNALPRVSALFVECAFPTRLAKLAAAAHHHTPQTLRRELDKFSHDAPVFAINLKPMFRDEIVAELEVFEPRRVEIMLPGVIYEF
jgi:ribonuclease BN (tRNA processing enzyme)